MTVVFDDEELYTTLKVEAARTHRPARDLVADALNLLFAATSQERDAILGRSSQDAGGREVVVPVERVLQELGLARERRPL